MLINKRCRFCGKNFKAHTVKTKYCSHSCNSKHLKEKERDKRQQQLIKSGKHRKRSHQSILEEIQIKDYLSLKDCSLLLNVSLSTIKRIISEGELPSFYIRSRVIVIREDLNNYIKKQLENSQRKQRQRKIVVPNKAKYFNKANYYFMGEIPKYYNISLKSVERHMKSNGINKVKKGRFVYVLKSDIKKLFGAPSKTILND